MTYREGVRDFEDLYVDLYIKQVDYCMGFEAWAAYVDGLCKDGVITERQAFVWATPFPYGKNLKPKKRQLERKVYGY